MLENGRDLVRVLAPLILAGDDRIERITRQLKRWFPDIKSLNAKGDEVSGIRIAYRSESVDGLVPLSVGSDGLGHLLALLWVLQITERSDEDGSTTIGWEEPENGVHPRYLGSVMGALRGSVGLDRPNRRMLVSTHSLDVVSTLEPQEALDCLLLFDRDSKSGTRVRTLRETPVDVKSLLSNEFEGTIGSLYWSGLLGSTPSDPPPIESSVRTGE